MCRMRIQLGLARSSQSGNKVYSEPILCNTEREKPSYLVNIQHVRSSIPAPIPRLCCQFPSRNLNDLARTILSKKTNHGARAWSSIQPYRKLISGISSSNEPKECVRRVISRHVNPSCILLLGVEDGLTGACGWGLVRNGDIPIDRRGDGR